MTYGFDVTQTCESAFGPAKLNTQLAAALDMRAAAAASDAESHERLKAQLGLLVETCQKDSAKRVQLMRSCVVRRIYRLYLDRTDM